MICMFSAAYFVKFFGRKTLLIWGHMALAIIHSAIAVFNIYNVNIGVIVMMMVFEAAQAWTSGPIAWVYAAETVVDTGLGVVLFTLWFTVLILTFICPILMDPNSVGPTGMFFIFGGFSFLGGIYVIFIMKETKHLTDKEKKILFTPKKYLTYDETAE